MSWGALEIAHEFVKILKLGDMGIKNKSKARELCKDMTQNVKLIVDQVALYESKKRMTEIEELKYRQLLDLAGSTTGILQVLIDQFGKDEFRDTLVHYDRLKERALAGKKLSRELYFMLRTYHDIIYQSN